MACECGQEHETASERDAHWVSIIEGLQGTCNSLEADEDHAGLLNDLDFCALLDSLVFCCELCNWWCELSEMGNDGNSNGICRDCCMDQDIDMDED